MKGKEESKLYSFLTFSVDFLGTATLPVLKKLILEGVQRVGNGQVKQRLVSDTWPAARGTGRTERKNAVGGQKVSCKLGQRKSLMHKKVGLLLKTKTGNSCNTNMVKSHGPAGTEAGTIPHFVTCSY